MLLEAAIGDAYGAGFEYVSGDDLKTRPNDLTTYHSHPRHPIGNGRYTDDTEMSTAVVEAILNDNFHREGLADAFVAAFKREQRPGYAGRFYDFLKSVQTGVEFLSRIDPKSDKSGAAMRGWVCGVHHRIPDVLRTAKLQAQLTHDTPGGIRSAEAAAFMTHFFIYRRDTKDHLTRALAHVTPGPWLTPFVGSVGSSGIEAVYAAVTAVTKHNSMSAILKECIGYGGDVDTVATIALGAASWSDEIKQDLPQVLIDNLEQGEWGAPYLRSLDQRLLEFVGDRQWRL